MANWSVHKGVRYEDGWHRHAEVDAILGLAICAVAGIGPVISLADIGTFEVNEAFTPVALAWLKETGASASITNPDGGAIALGHPLGASGARLMTSMVHRMRRHGNSYGPQTMCEGGGLANATILESL